MKKHLSWIVITPLLVLLFLGSTTAPAFAATNQVNSVQVQKQQQARWPRAHHRSAYYHNQYLNDCRTHIKNKATYGANQANDGNQGVNFGNTRDSSSNEGNQFVNRGGGWGQVNQFAHTCGLTVNNQSFHGYNQGNDGNQGVNFGNTEDDSSNEGNLAIN